MAAQAGELTTLTAATKSYSILGTAEFSVGSYNGMHYGYEIMKLSPRSETYIAGLALVVSLLAAGYVAVGDRSRENLSKSPAGVLEKLIDTKRLRVGYVVNQGLVNRDAKTAALSGYHIDMLNRIAENADFSVDYEETTFSNMVAGLAAGKFDVVVGGGYESIARAREVAFSNPLMYISLGYISRTNDGRFTSEADLRRKGLRVAVTAGGASADYLKANLPEAIPVILTRAELTRIGLEVASGRADVGIGNASNCLLFEAENPNIKYVTKGKQMFSFASGFVARHGDPDWLQFLDSSIRQLQLNGFAAQLEAKYNPGGHYWAPVTRP